MRDNAEPALGEDGIPKKTSEDAGTDKSIYFDAVENQPSPSDDKDQQAFGEDIKKSVSSEDNPSDKSIYFSAESLPKTSDDKGKRDQDKKDEDTKNEDIKKSVASEERCKDSCDPDCARMRTVN